MNVRIGELVVGRDRPFTLISGPCQIESEGHAFEMAAALVALCRERGIGLIYKSSFDKANRTSLGAARGVGMERGLATLDGVRSRFGVPVLTDVPAPGQCAVAAQAGDELQLAAGETGAAVNVKKGQFLAPRDMANVAAKIASTGNARILLTERGTSFGYNTLVNDMRALPVMAGTGYPVVFDATHSVQQPGGLGDASGGQREYAPVLARAAVAVGVAAIFIETHQDPDAAPSDGPTMVPLQQMGALLDTLQAFDRLAKGCKQAEGMKP